MWIEFVFIEKKKLSDRTARDVITHLRGKDQVNRGIPYCRPPPRALYAQNGGSEKLR